MQINDEPIKFGNSQFWMNGDIFNLKIQDWQVYYSFIFAKGYN